MNDKKNILIISFVFSTLYYICLESSQENIFALFILILFLTNSILQVLTGSLFKPKTINIWYIIIVIVKAISFLIMPKISSNIRIVDLLILISSTYLQIQFPYNKNIEKIKSSKKQDEIEFISKGTYLYIAFTGLSVAILLASTIYETVMYIIIIIALTCKMKSNGYLDGKRIIALLQPIISIIYMVLRIILKFDNSVTNIIEALSVLIISIVSIIIYKDLHLQEYTDSQIE